MENGPFQEQWSSKLPFCYDFTLTVALNSELKLPLILFVGKLGIMILMRETCPCDLLVTVTDF